MKGISKRKQGGKKSFQYRSLTFEKFFDTNDNS
jgi:hypothetical protein